MALFNFRIDVDSFLQISEPDRALFKRLVVAAEDQATALKALVAKVNEEDSPMAATVEITAGEPVEQSP